jgi:cell division protein FtsB
MGAFLEIFPIILAVSSPVLIIVFVVHYFRYRSEVAQRIRTTARDAEAENEELRRQIKGLRERVEVLEAIVTDKKYDLGSRIANL